MKNDLFEKAKQAVAKKHGFANWNALVRSTIREAPMDAYYQEVSQWMCNESVKADRDRILNQSFPDSKKPDSIYLIEASAVYGDLPFPQQPDEI